MGRVPVPLGVPGWVTSDYAAFGVRPTLALQFAKGRAWSIRGGAVTPESLLTVSRASAAYIDDLSGNWSSVNSGILRRTNKGALIEESRTNSLRNNSMQGAVAGTPGTLPTNWSATLAGLTQTVVGTGTANGIDYVDIQFSGTTSGTGFQIGLETSTAIAATTGQTWSASAFFALVGGDFTNITTIKWRLSERTNVGGLVQNDDGSDFKASITASLGRISQITTLSGGGTTANLQPLISLGCNNTSAVNFTIRIGWPQLELGAFATSPIRTTSAAATRASDVVTVTRLPGTGDTLTAYAAFIAPVSLGGVNRDVVVFADAGVTNTEILFINPGSARNASQNATASAASQGRIDVAAAFSAGASVKAAFAATLNDRAVTSNGGAVSTSGTNGAKPAFTTIGIGSDGSGNSILNTYITDIAVWASARIPNAGLIAGTT